MAKTKALISCAVTAQLVCVFVFAYAKSRFSHNEALMKLECIKILCLCTSVVNIAMKQESHETSLLMTRLMLFDLYFKVHEDFIHDCSVCHPGDPRHVSPATLDDNIITEEGEEEEKEEDEETLRWVILFII